MVAPQNPKKPSLRSRAAQGILWTKTQMIGAKGTALVVFLVLAHLLAPEDFGLYAYAQAFVLVVQAITESGLSAVVVQREHLDSLDLDSLCWGNLGLSALLTAGGLAAGPSLADVLREPALAPLLQVLSLGFFLAALSTPRIGILRRELRFRALTVRSVSSEVVGGRWQGRVSGASSFTVLLPRL